MNQGIAVVGLACRYPDAANPRELWENVLAKRRAFRRLPTARLDLADYPADDPDGISVEQAAVLRDYKFDRVRFRVTGSGYRSADLAHWLALEVASEALADAGFPEGRALPTERAGVLLGNTLTGDGSRANLMRLRWPYVRRVLSARLAAEGWSVERSTAWLAELEAEYKAPFPPLDEESLAGGLSNTIAGRICNHFDLRGGGFTVDGACASSLLAVAQACSALTAGDLDLALAGGVDLSLDPFELVGFSRTGALSNTDMRVYDRRADGFWPGEGCGFVVLLRAADALALGLRSYGLIRGWGIASDGGGGITRPEADGQRLALERAYARARYSIADCALIEGHGTGTSVGDSVELKALNQALAAAGADPARPLAIGSIKANIGHTKAAAGIAGLLKALQALNAQILPPATNCTDPHAELNGPKSCLRSLSRGCPWPLDRPLRAGVSAFGFGGIDVHVTVEGAATTRRMGLTDTDRRLLHSPQDTELFLLHGADAAALAERARDLAETAGGLAFAELTDLAAALARAQIGAGGMRAALLASSPGQLVERLLRLADAITAGVRRSLDADAGVLLAEPSATPRIAFLFSGQSAPVLLEPGAMGRRFPAIAELYRAAELPALDDGSTAVAQPAIIAGQRAALELMAHLGIQAEVALGHSLGELTALHWAGAMDGDTLQGLARLRGRLMSTVPGPLGGMTAVLADADAVADLLAAVDDPRLSVSCYNSTSQTVVSGPVAAVDGFTGVCLEQGLRAQRLAVGHAFHSPLMAPARAELRAAIEAAALAPLARPVISTVSADLLPADVDLSALLGAQLTSPVRFTEAARRLLGWGQGVGSVKAPDLCLELGPGQVLTSLLGELTPDAPVLSVDSAGKALAPLWLALGAAWVVGAPLRRERLFDDRLTRPWAPLGAPKFITSPCEQAPRPDADRRIARPAIRPIGSAEAAPLLSSAPAASDGDDPLELLRAVVAAKTELPAEAVTDDSRLLVDLHLNSISVGQIVAEASRRLGLPAPAAPTDYADATLGAIAQSLRERRLTGATTAPEQDPFPAGVGHWVHPFALVWREQALPRIAGPARPRAPGGWSLMCPSASDTVDTGDIPELESLIGDLPGGGLLLWLPAAAPEAQIALLLETGRRVVEERRAALALIQQGAAAAPLARTMALEHPEFDVLVLDAPPDAALALRIKAELAALSGFVEVRYDADGTRLRPQLVPLPHAALAPKSADPEPPLGPEDVLLVSGGGKGIAAEAALALARSGGAALALIGRSDPATDTALASNLERLRGLGIRFHYARADVTEAAAVARAVADCQQALGPITGLLHGAGVNQPRLLHELDAETAAATIAPKAAGFDHLLAAIDPERLRLLVSFGSIIARSGLRGEADYALANEALARRTEAFAAAHPHCRCLCLEWSIWSGVGMGERLGRIDALLAEGITPVAPDAGVELLTRLVATPDLPVRLVASGRLGALRTLRPGRLDLPLGRFLDPVRLHVPGVELIVEPDLAVATDPYLAEHALAGEPLFPTVMGLEAMAQVGRALLGRNEPPCFEQVELLAPIPVPTERPQAIRIAALARSDERLELVIRSAVDGFQQDRFRARLRYGAAAKAAARGNDQREQAAATAGLAPPAPAGQADASAGEEDQQWAGVGLLDPDRDVYPSLLFHHGRFQRIRRYQHLDAWHCRFEIDQGEARPWFSALLPGELRLGDPGSRDAGLHGIQACIPHARLLPVAVARIEPGDPLLPGPWIAEAQETAADGREFTYDLVVRDYHDRLRERWQGLKLRRIEPIAHAHWHPGLLVAYLQRRAEELLQGRRLRLSLTNAEPALDEAANARGHLAGGANSGAGVGVRVLYRSDGRPERSDGHGLSAAHAGPLSLTCIGDGPLACDLEPIAARGEAAWAELLGSEHLLLARTLAGQLGDGIDAAATRVWCALECLKKSGASSNAPLTLVATEPDGWALLASGAQRLATVRLCVRSANPAALPEPDAHQSEQGLVVALSTEAIGAQL